MSSPAPRAVEVDAPAKVNLLLRVMDRRPSGYHELETLFQAVGLYDRLYLARTLEPGVTLEVLEADLGPAEDNLVFRAARAYLEAAGAREGVRVRLHKRIPAGSGLGGGSSDAGAALRALDRVFDGAVAQPALMELGARLGSDVPFFLGPSPLALGEGRGERLTPLPALPEAALVLGLPPVRIATGSAYEQLALAREVMGSGAPPPVLAGSPPGDWPRVAEVALNDFETVVVPAHPAVGRALRALRTGDALLTLLSGSGGAVFGVYPDPARAAEAAEAARRAAPETRFLTVPTLVTMPAPREAPLEP